MPAADPGTPGLEASAAAPQNRVAIGPQVASLADVPLPGSAAMPHGMDQRDGILSAASVTFDPTLLLDGRPAKFAPGAASPPARLAIEPHAESDRGLPGRQAAAAPTSTAKPLFVQAGAFLDADNALRLRSRLAGQLDGISDARIVPVSSNGKLYNCVRVGPFASEDEARRVMSRMAVLGFGDALIIAQ